MSSIMFQATCWCMILLFVAQLTQAQVTCVDSPLVFRYQRERKSCSTCVAQDSTRCELGGGRAGTVSSHCPATCGINDCTGIESDMWFEVLINDTAGSDHYVPKFKNCAWLLKDNCNRRCARPGFRETCPLSCAQCPATDAPSMAPSVTMAPSISPAPVALDSTPAPSLSPPPSTTGNTKKCVDSPLTFQFKRREKNCSQWVKGDPDQRCKLGRAHTKSASGFVKRHCPVTCEYEDCTELESNMRFKVLLEKPAGSGEYQYRWKTCSWVLKANCENKCEKFGVAETCHVSCSQCNASSNPSSAPVLALAP